MSRGRVRFELLLGQVLAALPEPPARVVDAGGGTGQLAVALARRGYQVTVVDTSAAMLATCAQRAAGEGADVATRLATVQGDAADLPALLGPASRDAAVCHDLITQVDDPAAVLAALAGVLCDGGGLSLGFANRDWLVLRAGRRGEHAGALRLAHGREAGRPAAPGTPGHAAPAMTLAEVEAELERAGFEAVAASGVGVFVDSGDDDPDPAGLAALVELERLVATREPYRSSARTVHVVGRRRILRPDLGGYTP
ncbi:MAG TPA: methyltransferase domain-containing protein [Actinomycetota bacterium]|nr:methyltransferase domain-containing protein [Actinomycetota bacterium]